MADRMPKLDNLKDKTAITPSIADYMKLIEKQNLERVAKLQRIRRNNLITGFSLGACVIGIFTYSILSVRQETFLDDFDKPAIKEVDTKL